MASKFQSRLVGTILLVSVGVIVLPDLLDGKKQHYKEELAPIPIKPELEGEVEVFEVLEPVEDDLVLPDSPVSVTIASTESEPEEIEVTPRPVAEKNDYADSAWIIQLMALKNVENAKKLVKDLQKRGYQAHIKQENEFSRVIIGPDVSKPKLEKQIKELEKITGAKGQLLKFKPLNP
ncbi:putative DedD protein [Vibrio nigripulchritudo MADA3029]|uniref:SPOR domain-containing protein n=1 Tax=Vibrio TaxID=662 RepID=UPI0003B23D9C|nr:MULTISPECIES: SPOR domain-containing protein [Vibrio]UAB71327.1 SPOR domain-containing protein [Vibrio sp. SCSIO 43132]CCN46711.1 putative DedD protein [Vibrio nigripulchritudo MADA3020]CCN51428.1 putative DedD protein [Vibrio nigripulchritudo MADA3021]CCN59227.1 putative DedD protein [Vibrio nigripulchritudo MADA3029]